MPFFSFRIGLFLLSFILLGFFLWALGCGEGGDHTHPGTEPSIPPSSQNYVLLDLVGISPVIGASLSPDSKYSEAVGVPNLGEQTTSANYILHGH